MSQDIDDDDDVLPAFLRLTTEERAEGRRFLPPPPPALGVPAPVPAKPNPAIRGRTQRRLARMKQNLELNNIPPQHRRWDLRRSRWVDTRVDTGQESTMSTEDTTTATPEPAILLVPYHGEAKATRGHSSISAAAEEHEIRDELVAVAKKSTLKKTSKIDIVDPDGSVRETWTVDFATKSLHKEGTELSIPVIEERKKMPSTATKDKPVKVKSARKSAGVSAGNRRRTPAAKAKAGRASGRARSNSSPMSQKPGVIATIVETICRDKGATQEEILAVLTKRFPDRNADSMLATTRIQANKNARKKDKDERRGLVYYG